MVTITLPISAADLATCAEWRTPNLTRRATGVSWDKAGALEALPVDDRDAVVETLGRVDAAIIGALQGLRPEESGTALVAEDGTVLATWQTHMMGGRHGNYPVSEWHVAAAGM